MLKGDVAHAGVGGCCCAYTAAPWSQTATATRQETQRTGASKFMPSLYFLFGAAPMYVILRAEAPERSEGASTEGPMHLCDLAVTRTLGSCRTAMHRSFVGNPRFARIPLPQDDKRSAPPVWSMGKIYLAWHRSAQLHILRVSLIMWI